MMRGWLVLGATILASCGDSDQQQAACTPGESIACAGENACTGFQVCSPDGGSFGPCQCGSTAVSSGASTSAGSGGGSSASSASSGATSSSASSGSGGAGGAGAFSPDDLPGLALWLHTGAGIVFDPQNPGVVLKWDDQSPHAHQAIGNTQMGWQPVIDPSAINGYDGVRCLGNGYGFTIADDPSLNWGTNGFLLAAVLKPGSPSPSNATRLWSKTDVDSYFELSQPALDTLKLDVGPSSVATTFAANPPQYHLVIVRGMDLELRVGASLSTGPTATQSIDSPGAPVLFCGGGSTELRVVEFIAVAGEVTDNEADQVRVYLADKYGL